MRVLYICFVSTMLELLISAPAWSQATSCRLPVPVVERDHPYYNVSVVNSCGFQVTIRFTVTQDKGKQVRRTLIASQCGGRSTWQGLASWKIDGAWDYEYDDSRAVVCGTAKKAEISEPPGKGAKNKNSFSSRLDKARNRTRGAEDEIRKNKQELDAASQRGEEAQQKEQIKRSAAFEKEIAARERQEAEEFKKLKETNKRERAKIARQLEAERLAGPPELIGGIQPTYQMMVDCSYPSASPCYRRECRSSGRFYEGDETCALECAAKENLGNIDPGTARCMRNFRED